MRCLDTFLALQGGVSRGDSTLARLRKVPYKDLLGYLAQGNLSDASLGPAGALRAHYVGGATEPGPEGVEVTELAPGVEEPSAAELASDEAET